MGIDRFAMLMAGKDSLRDVTAFPKAQSGGDPLTGAPAPVDDAQLQRARDPAARRPPTGGTRLIMAELTPEQAALFGPPNLAYLATVNADGSPHLAPLWADTRGRHDRAQHRGRPRQGRERARDPRVAVAIHDKEHPHPPVLDRGHRRRDHHRGR